MKKLILTLSGSTGFFLEVVISTSAASNTVARAISAHASACNVFSRHHSAPAKVRELCRYLHYSYRGILEPLQRRLARHRCPSTRQSNSTACGHRRTVPIHPSAGWSRSGRYCWRVWRKDGSIRNGSAGIIYLMSQVNRSVSLASTLRRLIRLQIRGDKERLEARGIGLDA